MAIDTSIIRTYSQVLGNIDGSGNGLRDFIANLTLDLNGFNGRTVDLTDTEWLIQSFLMPVSLEFANSYYYDDFLQRAISPTALLEVDNDLNYKANLAAALHYTSTQLQTLIDTIFDYHADGAGIQRKGSTSATCPLQVFSRPNIPTFDILIPAGTQVSTTSTSILPAVLFQTLSNVIMYASLASTYLNPITGNYEIASEIEAISTGASGNQNAGAINIVVTTLNDIQLTTNRTKSAGGLDKETNSQLVSSITTALAGTNHSTGSGIFKTAFDVQNVSDAMPIGSNDPLMIRDLGNGGKIDVYIQSNNNSLTNIQNELHLWSGVQNDYVMVNQPVEANLSLFPVTVVVYNSSGAQVGTLTIVTHFNFVKDRDIAPNYREWSAFAQDKITLTTAGQSYIAGLVAPYNLGLSYTYDALVLKVQNIFSSDDGHDLTVDIQVRKAKYAVFNSTIKCKIMAGFTVDQVSNSISSIISSMYLISDRLLSKIGIRAQMIQNIQAQASVIGITEVITNSAGFTFVLSEGNDDLTYTSAVIDSNLDIQINRSQFLQSGTVTVQSV